MARIVAKIFGLVIFVFASRQDVGVWVNEVWASDYLVDGMFKILSGITWTSEICGTNTTWGSTLVLSAKEI